MSYIEEKEIIRHSLQVYLSNLREEIAKTEKHEFSAKLNDEEDVLKATIEKLP